jgi:hypothetical protein
MVWLLRMSERKLKGFRNILPVLFVLFFVFLAFFVVFVLRISGGVVLLLLICFYLLFWR